MIAGRRKRPGREPARRRAGARAHVAALALALAFLIAPTPGAARPLALALTTSIEASGLMAYLLPLFERASGLSVRAIVAGTGQALRLARNGDVDVTLTHDRASEQALVEEGFATERRDVMRNDFVLVGPDDDPAGVRGLTDAVLALRRIAAAQATFLSRGDDSGTHKAELRLWRAAGIDPGAFSGGWYLETGTGQGVNLNIAAGRGGYALTDRGTWIAFGNRAGLAILVEGDARLDNPYGVTLVDPARHPEVDAADARAFADWLTSPAGQAAIAEYRIDGEQLFFPDYAQP